MHRDGGGDRGAVGACDLLQDVGRVSRRRNDRSHVDAARDEQRSQGPGGEGARRGRTPVDRDEPAPAHVVGAPRGPDRDRPVRPRPQALLDPGHALAADVDPEDVHTRLRGSVELHGPDDDGADERRDDDADENDPPLHLQQ